MVRVMEKRLLSQVLWPILLLTLVESTVVVSTHFSTTIRYWWITTGSVVAPKRVAIPSSIGKEIRLPVSGVAGGLISTSKAVKNWVLVVVGSCVSCSVNQVKLEDLVATKEQPILLILSGKTSQVPKDYLKPRTNFYVIAEGDARTQDSLAVSYPPAYFLLNADRQVVDQQSFVGELPKFLITRSTLN